MENYTFSLAEMKDISQILGIYHSLIGTPGCTWNLEYPDSEIAASDIRNESLYVLKEEGKIIAAASANPLEELKDLTWKPKNPCELARLAVIPAMQNRGIATMILENVLEAVKEKGFDGAVLLVSKNNSAALALYHKKGFERCGEAFLYGINFYCYQLMLDTAAVGRKLS